jgi:hypothetical protein
MVKITLNKNFYTVEAIKEALHDYEEVCRGRVINDNIEIELESKEELQDLQEEFCNYVLGLMKNKTAI